MRLSIQIEGLKEVQASLRDFSDRRMAAAAATALTRTARQMKEGIQEQLPSIFDRPTAYTLGGIGFTGAQASSLEAQVFVKDQQSGAGRPAAVYLATEVTGGARPAKGFEKLLQSMGVMPSGWRAVPGAGALLDASGNVGRTQLGQIIRELRSTKTVGPQRKGFESKSIAARRKAGGQYFAVLPGTKGLKPGIYLREFTGRNVLPVLVFVKQTNYPVRFDFVARATAIAERVFGPNLEQAIAESAARLAARG